MDDPRNLFHIAVTEPDYDDMGAILTQMGFSYTIVDDVDLASPQEMRKLDILFINCQGYEPTWEAAKNVREMVDRGGALYVSCYARKWIDLIWPEYMEFHGNGEKQSELYCRVIDPGLQEFLGVQELWLNYNTHWHGISKIKIRDGRNAVHEYLRGQRVGWYEEEPLLVSFPYGDGFVIFTTFHNSAQVSQLENLLLQYLVIKPLMARKAYESNTIILEKKFTPTKELVGMLSVGEESRFYQYYLDTPKDLKFVFNWQGKATGRITVFDPTGRPIFDQNVRTSPHEVDVTKAIPGTWMFKLKIVDAPLAKFPFTINVGIKDALSQEFEQKAAIARGEYRPAYAVPASQQPTQQPSIAKADEQSRKGEIRNLTLKLLAPYEHVIGQFDISRGQKYSIGREELPENLHHLITVATQHIQIQLLDENQLIVRDVSPAQLETSATTFRSGQLEEQQFRKLTKNLPIAFKFPVLVLMGDEVILEIR
jgi:hypothetical protein